MRPPQAAALDVALDLVVHPREPQGGRIEPDSRLLPGELHNSPDASSLRGVHELPPATAADGRGHVKTALEDLIDRVSVR